MWWLAIWKLLRGINWRVYATLAFACAVAAALLYARHRWISEGRAEVQQKWDQAVERGNAEIAAENLKRAAKQATAVAEVKAIGEEHARADRAALAEKDRTIAGLRSGAIRVRKQWAGYLSATQADRNAGSAGGADANADIRGADAPDLAGAVGGSIYLGDTANAQVIALQGIVRAQQKLCSATP